MTEEKLTLDEIQRVAHQNAVDKGFWEDPEKERMEFASATAILHSLVSEVLESDRNKDDLGRNDKLRALDEVIGFLLYTGRAKDLLNFMMVKPSIDLTKMALIHSEVSEGTDTLWKNTSEDNMGEELADAIIRIGDYAGGRGVRLGYEVTAKMVKNRSRPHMHGGKAY